MFHKKVDSMYDKILAFSKKLIDVHNKRVEILSNLNFEQLKNTNAQTRYIITGEKKSFFNSIFTDVFISPDMEICYVNGKTPFKPRIEMTKHEIHKKYGDEFLGVRLYDNPLLYRTRNGIVLCKSRSITMISAQQNKNFSVFKTDSFDVLVDTAPNRVICYIYDHTGEKIFELSDTSGECYIKFFNQSNKFSNTLMNNIIYDTFLTMFKELGMRKQDDKQVNPLIDGLNDFVFMIDEIENLYRHVNSGLTAFKKLLRQYATDKTLQNRIENNGNATETIKINNEIWKVDISKKHLKSTNYYRVQLERDTFKIVYEGTGNDFGESIQSVCQENYYVQYDTAFFGSIKLYLGRTSTQPVYEGELHPTFREITGVNNHFALGFEYLPAEAVISYLPDNNTPVCTIHLPNNDCRTLKMIFEPTKGNFIIVTLNKEILKTIERTTGPGGDFRYEQIEFRTTNKHWFDITNITSEFIYPQLNKFAKLKTTREIKSYLDYDNMHL